jgi:hypothetical protein
MPPTASSEPRSGRARALDGSSTWIAPTAEPAVEVRRSKRRRKTVSAYRDGDRIIWVIPSSGTRYDSTLMPGAATAVFQ